MPVWLIWFMAAAVLAVLEIMIPGFFMLILAGGALAASIAAGFGAGILGQLVSALAALCAAAFLLFRPSIIRKRREKDERWNAERLIGADARVTAGINPPEKGRAAVSGIEWEAVSKEPMEKGEIAEIEAVGGAVLYLRKKRQ